MIGDGVKTTILSALLLLSLLSRQGAFLLHHPHREVNRCELIKTKSDRGICHFHESAVKCVLRELITQPVSTFRGAFLEFSLFVRWPETGYSELLQQAPTLTESKAPTLRGPPVA